MGKSSGNRPRKDIRCALFGASVRGYSHQLHDVPNQDALGLFQSDNEGLNLVAVADGHGDPRSFRSADGAKIAVEVAVEILRKALNRIRQDKAEDQTDWMSKIPRLIWQGWRDRVENHLRSTPFQEDEEKRIAQEIGESFLPILQDNPWLAYGATLLVAATFEQSIYFFQIGDGDILLVGEDGAVGRPIPADDRLIGNWTTSLCLANAWRDFRMSKVFTTNNSVNLILTCTDGYSNSFPYSDDDFLKIGSDYLQLIKESGIQMLREKLPDILSQTSQRGSGDDISIAGIYIDHIQRTAKPKKTSKYRLRIRSWRYGLLSLFKRRRTNHG